MGGSTGFVISPLGEEVDVGEGLVAGLCELGSAGELDSAGELGACCGLEVLVEHPTTITPATRATPATDKVRRIMPPVCRKEKSYCRHRH